MEEEDANFLKAIEESLKENCTSPPSDDLPHDGDCLSLAEFKNQFEIEEKTTATDDFDYQLTATIIHLNGASTSARLGHYVANVFRYCISSYEYLTLCYSGSLKNEYRQGVPNVRATESLIERSPVVYIVM